MENYKEEYDKIVSEINKLTERKFELEKLMFDNSDSFVDKFRIWYNNEDDGHHESMISYPKLRKLFDEIEYPRRGKTYELYDLINEYDFWCFINGDEDDDYFNLSDFLEKYQPALEEAMEYNVKSFDCEW